MDLNRLAIELDLLARTLFRNDLRGGVLSHHEDEIRQDAILTALRWFAKGNKTSPAENESPAMLWNSARAMAAALKFAKRQYSKRLFKDASQKAELHEARAESCSHYFDLSLTEWPEATVQELIRQAIHLAVKSRRVSRANARIALLVLHDDEPVTRVAERFGVHSTAIYQRLNRVRRSLTDIVGTLEMPLHW